MPQLCVPCSRPHYVKKYTQPLEENAQQASISKKAQMKMEMGKKGIVCVMEMEYRRTK